ncbi:hypothetical protein BEE12_16090 [Pantoea agglomerans]|uniref:hypothetical protein n=1 Tax=Enterobacter agglomerans TaxID=549 RepID=UPI00083DE28B|nr:hypothetical protein [Pantoea agglomerans]AOE41237.1 hypothetical protein BEE12_16090 [Pantoea agglomerans]
MRVVTDDKEANLSANNGAMVASRPQPGVFSGSGTTMHNVAAFAYNTVENSLADAAGVNAYVAHQNGDVKLAQDLLSQQQSLLADNMHFAEPDPVTTGAGTMLIDGLMQAGASAATLGTFGMAKTTGELVDQGVNREVASKVGLATGATDYALNYIPGFNGFGGGLIKYASRFAMSAGVNVAAGWGTARLKSEILEQNGYAAQAKQFATYDQHSMITDAILGGLLGLHGGGHTAAEIPPGIRAAAENAWQDSATMNAAAVKNMVANHLQVDSAPGIPATPRAENAHVAAMRQASEQIMRGEPVNVGDVPGLHDEPYIAPVNLAELARQRMDRGERKVWQSEIANGERHLAAADAEIAAIKAEPITGSGKALADARARRAERLADANQRRDYIARRLQDARDTLAPHMPGGDIHAAQAEISRQKQGIYKLVDQDMADLRETRLEAGRAPAEENPFAREETPAPAKETTIPREESAPEAAEGETAGQTPEAGTATLTPEQQKIAAMHAEIRQFAAEQPHLAEQINSALDAISATHATELRESRAPAVAMQCFLNMGGI